MVVPIRENITQYYNILIITNNTPLITAMNTLTVISNYPWEMKTPLRVTMVLEHSPEAAT